MESDYPNHKASDNSPFHPRTGKIPVVLRHPADHHEGQGKQGGDEDDERPAVIRALHRCDVIVCSVQQDGHDNGKNPEESAFPFLADIIVALGKRIEDSHEDAEAGMPGNGGDCPDQCGRETVHGHIRDVFPQREAKGDCNGIDHPVVQTVELRVVPGPFLQEHVFGKLFRDCDNGEIKKYVVCRRSPWNKGVEKGAENPFAYDGEESRDDSADHKASNQTGRFPLDPVGPVDFDEKKNRRQNRRGNKQPSVGKIRRHHPEKHVSHSSG